MERLIILGIHVLEWMFIVGWALSLLVLIITGIEDFETILRRDKPIPQEPQA